MGMGTAGESHQSWALLSSSEDSNRGTPSSFPWVMQIYDLCMPLGVLDRFCKEETSSTPLSKPDVFRYGGFTLCIQMLKMVLYCKVSLNTWKLEGVTWNPEITSFMPWKSVKDFHGNSKNTVKSISINRHILAHSHIFIFPVVVCLCFTDHCDVSSGQWSVKSIPLQ